MGAAAKTGVNMIGQAKSVMNTEVCVDLTTADLATTELCLLRYMELQPGISQSGNRG